MTEQDRIKEGDVVQVEFNNARVTLSHAAIVVATPCGPGDSWVFRNTETGFLHYVSEGCTISKRESPNERIDALLTGIEKLGNK